ncbi:zinc-binding dehydrogenase [Streptomyces sp. NPDC004728]|uniref:zinc-binding dehydrogenase n=1 Tax=Streptomyces sp. NPDC004728 TaxID=3154289 RepID=UPI0033B0A006
MPGEGDPREGVTASHLSTGTYPIGPGDTAVVHAAAGGVGLLRTQMVRAHGGRVIGLVSREGKAPVAKEAGADHVLVHSGGGFEERTRELTGERGADVACGGGTGMFHFSQPALRPHGVHAYCGPFTAAPTLLPTDLPDSSLLTYPVVHHHVATREHAVEPTFLWRFPGGRDQGDGLGPAWAVTAERPEVCPPLFGRAWPDPSAACFPGPPCAGGCGDHGRRPGRQNGACDGRGTGRRRGGARTAHDDCVRRHLRPGRSPRLLP